MRNQYKNLENSTYLVCLMIPLVTNPQDCAFTPMKRWVDILNDFNHHVDFNVHSPFGDYFCTETYLRKQKLEKLKNEKILEHTKQKLYS